MDTYLQYILMASLHIFGHLSKKWMWILQCILYTWEPVSVENYSENDIIGDKKLLQETNPVRLQPFKWYNNCTSTIATDVHLKPAQTHLSRKDNFAK